MLINKLDKTFPIISLIGLFLYFLFDGFFTTSFGKLAFLVFCSGLVSIDLIYRILTKGFSTKEGPRFLASSLGIGAILSYVIRGWLDFPVQAGMAEGVSIIPKLREFLLALSVVLTIAFLVYTILLEIGRRSLEAQSILSDKKRGLLQNTIVGFLLLVPLLVAINYVAIMRNYNFDLSEKGKYSLSSISKNILRGIDKPVEIIAFYPRPLEADGPGTSLSLTRIRPDLEILMDQYRASNPNIQTRFINADVEMDLLSGMGQVSNGNILVRASRDFLPGDSTGYNEEKLSVREESDLEDIERKLTSAILNVTSKKRKAYFTSANGERYGSGFRNLRNEQITNFTSALHYLNFQINELGFAEGWPKDIPDDAGLVVIIGPTVPLNERARVAILNYSLERKGKLFISIEPKGKEDFSWLLNKAGIRFQSELLSQVETKPGMVVARDFPEHPIADSLPKKEIGIVFPYSGSLETFSDGSSSFSYLTKFILDSGPDAFVDPLGTGKQSVSNPKSNFHLGVVLQSIDPKNSVDSKIDDESRIVVFSGTSWLTDQFISYNMNKNIALSSVSWMFQDAIINDIPMKKDDVQTINITDNQKILVWLIGMFLFPGAIIIGGSYYVISRRKKGDDDTL